MVMEVERTAGVDLQGRESCAGTADESGGLWNKRCAMDRSIGLVSVSISINPEHLKHETEKQLSDLEHKLTG